MDYRILVINGATRSGGNTDSLVKTFFEGAKAAGIQLNHASLRDLDISDCRGCYQCRDKGTCSISDDMTGLREDIERVDVLVIASPLYFCGV